MKKWMVLSCVLLTVLVSGCCRGGGLRGLLRGGACNACQPSMDGPMSDSNLMGSCEDGTCGHDHGAIGTGTDMYYGNSLSTPATGYGNSNGGGSLGSAIAPPSGAPLPGPGGN
jgi:hypothetical protein